MKDWNKYLAIVEERPQLFTKEGLEIILDKEIITTFESGGGREIGIAYESPWRYMLVDLVRNETGQLFAYERIVPVKTGGVAILPIYEEDKMVLVKQYRHPTQCWNWEIPRGFGEGAALTAMQNAAKELLEETGIKMAKFSHLGKLSPDSGLTSDQIDLFLAEIKEPNVTLNEKEETEAITKVKLFPLDEVKKLIVKGEITDSFTLSALGLWQLRKEA